MNRHHHLKLVSKLFRQQFRSPTLKIVEKYTRNYYAVVKKLQRFQSRCKYLQRRADFYNGTAAILIFGEKWSFLP